MMRIDFRAALEPFVNEAFVGTIQHGVNAQRHAAFTHQFVERLDHERSDLSFVDRSQAVADALASRELHGALRLRQRHRRNVFGNELLRVIQQDARGLAGFFVTNDFSILRILSVLVDPSKLERAAVGPGRKSVKADEKAGLLGVATLSA